MTALIPSVVEWVRAIAAGSVVRMAATAARASAMRWRRSRNVVHVAATDAELVVRHARPWRPPSRPAAARTDPVFR